MGQPKGALKPDTNTFKKKTTGNPILIEKTEISKYDRAHPPKVPVPKKDERPIHGLVSDKNFIVANAVENILAAPKLASNKDKDYLKK